MAGQRGSLPSIEVQIGVLDDMIGEGPKGDIVNEEAEYEMKSYSEPWRFYSILQATCLNEHDQDLGLRVL